MKTHVLLVTGGLCLGVTLGAYARSQTVTRYPIAAGPVSEPSNLNDGYEPLVTVDVEPNAVLNGPSSQSLEYRISIKSRSATNIKSTYVYEVINDVGASQQAPAKTALPSIAAKAGHDSFITTPPGLKDGYFQVRVTAAAADGSEDTVQVAERYFLVKHGTVTPVTSDEWFKQSAANGAHKS